MCNFTYVSHMRMRFHCFRLVDRVCCCSGPSCVNRFSGIVHRIRMYGFACIYIVHSKCSRKIQQSMLNILQSICVLCCKRHCVCAHVILHSNSISNPIVVVVVTNKHFHQIKKSHTSFHAIAMQNGNNIFILKYFEIFARLELLVATCKCNVRRITSR